MRITCKVPSTQAFTEALQFELLTPKRSTHDGLSSVELAGGPSCIARTCHCEKRRASLSLFFQATHDTIVTDCDIAHMCLPGTPVSPSVQSRRSGDDTCVDRSRRPDIRASRASICSSLASSQIECEGKLRLLAKERRTCLQALCHRKRPPPHAP